MSASAARVWMTTGFPSSRGEGELLREEALLIVPRRVVAEPVETGLPHGDRARVSEQLAHLGDVRVGRRARLVRMDAEDREDLVELLRSSSARLQPAGVVPTVRIRVTPAARARATTSAGSSSSASRCACVSITAALGLDAERASSSAAVSGASLRKSGLGSRSAWPGASPLGAHEPTQLS